MRGRIILALSLSAILIGVASWQRLAQARPATSPELIVVDRGPEDNSYYEELLRSYASTSTNAVSSGEKLTETDLIGRQLILDYVELASSGQASGANLDLLANKYVESIPKLVSAEKISFSDLKGVPGSKEAFLRYDEVTSSIYTKYAYKMMEIQLEIISSGTAGQSGQNLSIKTSAVYRETAYALRDVSVPNQLLQAHLNLINLYLENSVAMYFVSESEKDPAKAFAGLVVINENATKENLYVSEIRRILKANGI